MTASIIDCHNHIFDPQRFPYGVDNRFHPDGPEINTTSQFAQLLDANGVSHALIVGPNSGYGLDNGALLDAVAHGRGRFKGVAVVPNDVSIAQLADLKSKGMVGIAINPTFDGIAYSRDIGPLLSKLEDLDLFLQIQVEGDMLIDLWPLISSFRGRMLFDHCGRPVPKNGLDQPGFRKLLDLAQAGRTAVKLSGHIKFSDELYPYADTWPFVRALVDAFTLDNCMWGSDWPCLRARERIGYGQLLRLTESLFPDDSDRRKLFWNTPARLFGFAE